ncbi:MAG: DUF6599 family protein [Acidobacteriaceae bacterium]
MKFFGKMSAVVVGALLCVPVVAGGQTLFQPTAQQMKAIEKQLGKQTAQTKKTAKPKALLPAEFAGWTRGSVSAMKPDAKDAAALKEFGFERGLMADYSRGGNSVAVRVWKFPDATGAYGAFTLMRTAGMKLVRVGSHDLSTATFSNGKNGKPPKTVVVPLTFFNGARAGDEFVFWTGDLLVESKFAGPVADASTVMTRLAGALPGVMGSRGASPTLPEQLPLDGLDRGSVRYSIGPVAYAQEGGVLPPAVLDFDTDPEVVMAQYGQGMLTVISYPTPEIAQAREAAIAGVLQSGAVAGPKDALRVKRSGPLVAMTSGEFTGAQADALLKQVEFRATVSMEQVKPEESEVAKTAKLLVGIASLTIILGVAAVLLGFFLGGGRALYRVMRGKPASSVTDEEFIALELSKPAEEGASASGNRRTGE